MKSVQSGMRNYRVFVFLLHPLICISNIPRCHIIICELFIADLRDHHCPEEKYEEVQQQLNCKYTNGIEMALHSLSQLSLVDCNKLLIGG